MRGDNNKYWWHHACVFWLCILTSLSFSSCSEDDGFDIDNWEQEKEQYANSVYFHNNPLPKDKHQLRVLCIGNSFTNNALKYVCPLLAAAQVNTSSYSIYSLPHTGASVEHWWKVAESGEVVQLNYKGGERMPVEEGSLAKVVAQDWDVITLQQVSKDAVNYSTFNPWLQRLIDFILQHCTNPQVTLAWQTAWSYNQAYGKTTSYDRWHQISSAVLQMVVVDGIDVLIPTGTAIQNARSTELSTDEGELTCDGVHLDRNVGCYVASCTWVEAICGPVFDITVLGNELTPVFQADSTAIYPPTAVTPANRELCQRCAIAAVKDPFKVQNMDYFFVAPEENATFVPTHTNQ